MMGCADIRLLWQMRRHIRERRAAGYDVTQAIQDYRRARIMARHACGLQRAARPDPVYPTGAGDPGPVAYIWRGFNPSLLDFIDERH